MAPVANVTMIGCKRPYTTIAPFRKPAAAPAQRTMKTPIATSNGPPMTRVEAMQLVMMNIVPTDRSSPRVSTGTVCAMATSASSTAFTAAVFSTFGVK